MKIREALLSDPWLVTRATSHESRVTVLKWFLLGACGVFLFMSVTDLITSTAAPLPLFWVVPLAIYLLTFTLSFKQKPWCPAWIGRHIEYFIAYGFLYFLLIQHGSLPLLASMVLSCFFLFFLCLYCHSELSRLRPPTSGREQEGSVALARFYTIIAAGGFAGGMFISWVMPKVISFNGDYVVGLILVAVYSGVEKKWQRISLFNARLIVYMTVILICWPYLFVDYRLKGYLLIFGLFYMITRELKRNHLAFLIGLMAMFWVYVLTDWLWIKRDYLFRWRNYYGVYEVYDKRRVRYLTHSNVIHGAQLHRLEYRMMPVTYYGQTTPVFEVMTKLKKRDFHRVGVVGLGAGTLGAFAREGDVYDFYEIDPDVPLLARRFFSFLRNAKGEKHIIIGDARRSLEARPPQNYDLLIVDAYSGVSVPFHLLSTEGIRVFQKHLAKDGIILFHTSNLFLDLNPVVGANVLNLGGYVAFGKNSPDSKKMILASDYAAATWSKNAFEDIMGLGVFKQGKLPDSRRNPRPMWTDRYSYPVAVFRMKQLWKGLKQFKVLRW